MKKMKFLYFKAVHGTLSKVTQEKYELPTTFSDEAQDLVNSTLRKRPEDRPTILGLFKLLKKLQCIENIFLEIRDHPFFSKEFSRSSHSYNESNSYQKLSSVNLK
jgi:hypothetical protein